MNVPPIAQVIYGLAISADLAVDRGDDPEAVLMVAAAALAEHEAAYGTMPAGMGRVYVLDAQAMLVRALAGHDPRLIPDAERIEAARDLALATVPRLDA